MTDRAKLSRLGWLMLAAIPALPWVHAAIAAHGPAWIRPGDCTVSALDLSLLLCGAWLCCRGLALLIESSETR